MMTGLLENKRVRLILAAVAAGLFVAALAIAVVSTVEPGPGNPLGRALYAAALGAAFIAGTVFLWKPGDGRIGRAWLEVRRGRIAQAALVAGVGGLAGGLAAALTVKDPASSEWSFIGGYAVFMAAAVGLAMAVSSKARGPSQNPLKRVVTTKLQTEVRTAYAPSGASPGGRRRRRRRK